MFGGEKGRVRESAKSKDGSPPLLSCICVNARSHTPSLIDLTNSLLDTGKE